jgi:hypothetical protein
MGGGSGRRGGRGEGDGRRELGEEEGVGRRGGQTYQVALLGSDSHTWRLNLLQYTIIYITTLFIFGLMAISLDPNHACC